MARWNLLTRSAAIGVLRSAIVLLAVLLAACAAGSPKSPSPVVSPKAGTLRATPSPALPSNQFVPAGTATPDSVLLSGAAAASGNGDWPQAIRLLEQLLNRDPTSAVYKARLADARMAYGRAALSRGDIAAALHEFTVVHELDPQRSDALAALASLAPTATPPPSLSATPSAVPAVATMTIPPATPTPTALYVGTTGGDGVYLRRSPGGANLTAWPDGTVMWPTGKSAQQSGRGWLQVIAPDSSQGWVPTIYLIGAAPTATPLATR